MEMANYVQLSWASGGKVAPCWQGRPFYFTRDEPVVIIITTNEYNTPKLALAEIGFARTSFRFLVCLAVDAQQGPGTLLSDLFF
jgi:hypothetical protein